MKLRMQRIAYAMLILSFFVGGNVFAANSANPVKVDGDRLSIYAEGTTLGKLLMLVEDMTGVQFTFDELVAESKIFLDFRGLPISEGIERIVYPLNSVTIYDDSGKLRRVILLEQWKGSGMEVSREEGNSSLGGPAAGLSEAISFIPKAGFNNSVSRQGPPLGKGSVRTGRHSMRRSQKIEESPLMQDTTIEAPQVTNTSKVNGPPVEQSETMDGPLDVEDPDYPSAPDSRGDASDGPPVDMPYVIDGPPDLGDQGMDGPPGWQDQ